MRTLVQFLEDKKKETLSDDERTTARGNVKFTIWKSPDTKVKWLDDNGIKYESLDIKEQHPDRNMITRAIGGEETIEPDFYRFETCPGDVILLCTDGLYGEVSANRILQLSTEYSSMHELAKKLVDEANEAGGKDNISVVCIRIGG